MLYFYQHLPEYINPIAFSIGNFSVRWYSLAYLVGFIAVYYLLCYRKKTDNISLKISNSIIIDFLLYSFIGLIIGARLGYIFFYNLSYFIQNPLAVISPLDSSGSFVGIFGMSYFGGLVGVIIATFIFCRKNKINFWQWTDFVIPAIPAGYFFGRIGNFLNGELYGKATDHWWGMYFSGVLRYPTQLLEAFFEGIVLFAILWFLRGKEKFSGFLLAIYLLGYGIIRFFVEFLREPESGLILGLTNGQILSLGVIIFSAMIFLKNLIKLRFKKT